jgi:hypothetical protein
LRTPAERSADSFRTFWAQRRDDIAVPRHVVFVELVGVFDARVERLAVLLMGLGVSDTDAIPQTA